MTRSIEIAEAEAQLAALVDRAAAGEEIVGELAVDREDR
jgi:antitoxin (DNA-binding transcriptional repressor) of toxin-antitoxin stability system